MYNYAHFCFTLVARKQVCKFMLFAYIFLEMFVIIFSKRFVALISKDLFYFIYSLGTFFRPSSLSVTRTPEDRKFQATLTMPTD